MIEIKPMDEGYIHIDCMHNGPVDPALAPTRGEIWQDAVGLPPHPWSDQTIVELSCKYNSITEGWRGVPSREFMREMIQRYGTCAMLAWEDGKVVWQLRFYPLRVGQLVAEAALDKQPPTGGAMAFRPDSGTLWVQCVMTCRPYETSEEAVKAGARRGVGLKLALGLITWAREHKWRRIVAHAFADLDCFYGVTGVPGRAFWEKAGFKVIGTRYDEWPNDDDWKATDEAQAAKKGFSKKEAWTMYRMAYEL